MRIATMSKGRKASSCSWKNMGGGRGRRCFCGPAGSKKMVKSNRCK